MHDAIELEKLGVPAVAIATEPFKPGLDTLCRIRGMPEYRFAVVPHPIGPLPPDKLLERARQAAPQVAALVLQEAGSLK